MWGLVLPEGRVKQLRAPKRDQRAPPSGRWGSLTCTQDTSRSLARNSVGGMTPGQSTVNVGDREITSGLSETALPWLWTPKTVGKCFATALDPQEHLSNCEELFGCSPHRRAMLCLPLPCTALTHHFPVLKEALALQAILTAFVSY